MPDPLQYTLALFTAFSCSAVLWLAVHLMIRAIGFPVARIFCVVSLAISFIAGWKVLGHSWPWPPANALDRLLMIVMPLALLAETLASAGASPNRLRWVIVILRGSLYLSAGRILWHGSVYLPAEQIGVAVTSDSLLGRGPIPPLVIGAAILVFAALSLQQLCSRPLSGTVIFGVTLAILVAGLTTMLAGYIKGGAAALPLAGSLAGAGSALILLSTNRNSGFCDLRFALAAMGLMSLFGQLWIGRFFGQLTTPDALIIFLAPHGCWVTELPGIRRVGERTQRLLRLMAVSIPLAVIVFFGWQRFSVKLAPLVGTSVQQIEGKSSTSNTASGSGNHRFG